MEKSDKIKQILYSFLDEISEERIQKILSEGKSSDIISEILEKCIPKINLLDNNQDENLGILAESLMHYLLTNSLIPSQRKIEKDEIEINIVIPDLNTMTLKPEDSLVILFPKTSENRIIEEKIKEIKKIQPVDENIWLVLRKKIGINYKTFEISRTDNSFVKIVDEITKFLSTKKQTKLRIFKAL